MLFQEKSNAVSKLPAGTETEDWRVMSARIAWMLWSMKARQNTNLSPEEISRAWQVEAVDYRAYTRLALRHLAREDIHFGQRNNESITSENDNWNTVADRVAWMLWLTKRRSENIADRKLERTLWENEASNERAFVKSVLLSLENENIYLSTSARR